MTDTKSRKAIMLFLLFTFALPLVSILLIKNLAVFQSGFFEFFLFGYQAITPTLSALLVVTILYGRGQTGQFIKKCFICNIKAHYIMLAVLFPLITFVLTELSTFFFLDIQTFDITVSFPVFIAVLWALIAEEVGWRGYLQENLDRHLGKYLTPIAVGLTWALWHYHFFFVGFISVPFFLFTLGCVFDSFGYYWLTKKSKGNIIPASVMHFSWNLLFHIFMISPEHHQGNLLPYLIFLSWSFIMAVGITTWGVFSSKKEAA